MYNYSNYPGSIFGEPDQVPEVLLKYLITPLEDAMKRFQLLALTLLLSAPASLWAKPVEVLIFPAGAIVTEETGAAVVDGTVTLSLPQAADPDSLKVSTLDSAATLSGLQYESVLETTGDYQQLKDRIEATKTQLQTVEDRRLAKASALELWQGPLGEKFQNAEEYRKLAELMLTNSEQLNLEHSQLVREKKEIEKQLRELERKLAEATSRQKRSWSVRVALQDAKARETLHYSYRVRNADWQPVYSLDARPGEKQIRWDWTANVHQHTAADWREVHLLLATAEPVFTLTPPENVPWIIREAAHYSPAPAPTLARSKVSSAFAPVATEMDMAAVAKPPARQAGTLFDIYDLGRQTILAGESYQLNLRQGSWPASFDYLSRPLQSPQAFLSAKLEFDQLLPLPSGQAAILVEGVFVGKREFSLLEKKFELPFGNDPQIQIKVTPSREAAEEGLFGGDKSQSWQWQLEITNNKNIPVKLRIEDSLPRIEDKRIR
ncbi:MAG: mucoidy inhibitor MuiA family protein, partial [Desulfuromonadaceae bacterium]